MLGSPHISRGQTIWANGRVRWLRPQIVALSISPRLYNNARPPIDFQINPTVFSTVELTQIFDEKARYQRWLDFEAALAKVQGEMGVIPQEAAEEIGRKAKLELLDLESGHERP